MCVCTTASAVCCVCKFCIVFALLPAQCKSYVAFALLPAQCAVHVNPVVVFVLLPAQCAVCVLLFMSATMDAWVRGKALLWGCYLVGLEGFLQGA